MSEEGSRLLSHTLKSLDMKLNSLLVGSCGRKRKESEEGGRSAQRGVIKDLIQVKSNGATETSRKEKRSQYWRCTSGKQNCPLPNLRYERN